MKVFLKDIIHQEALEKLKENTEIIDDWEQIGEADAIIVRRIRLDADIYEKCPRLKVIGFHGSGIGGIDLQGAREHQVQVFTVPGENAQSVAELNIALALDVAHMVTFAAHEIKNGKKMKNALDRFVGCELWKKTAGIMGMGHIGKLTAQKLKAGFDMDIIGYSKDFTKQEAESLGVKKAATREEVLKQSDFVFLALPYSTETHHFIDSQELKMMRRNSILINTARGNLINEDALLNALESHTIAGAACDVFSKEPLDLEHPLMRMERFVPTPHIGGNTEEALYRVGMGVVNGILERMEKMQNEK